MKINEPTAIMADWLATDPTHTPRLEWFYKSGGIAAMRTEAERHLQVNASSNPTARRLLQWGIAHGPSRISRYRMLIWVFNQVDWDAIAAQLPRRTDARLATR
jgi:hypothetical protein